MPEVIASNQGYLLRSIHSDAIIQRNEYKSISRYTEKSINLFDIIYYWTKEPTVTERTHEMQIDIVHNWRPLFGNDISFWSQPSDVYRYIIQWYKYSSISTNAYRLWSHIFHFIGRNEVNWFSNGNISNYPVVYSLKMKSFWLASPNQNPKIIRKLAWTNFLHYCVIW